MVRIDDIAHGLARLCRFTGQCKTFYSVAEHSINVSKMVEPKLKMMALLHDAHEAYIGDISTPVKLCFSDGLEELLALDKRVAQVVAVKFGLPLGQHLDVLIADARMLMTERDALFDHKIPWDVDAEPYPKDAVIFSHLTPEDAEAAFLTAYQELIMGQ